MSALAAFGIAFITVFSQTFKASRANPDEILKKDFLCYVLLANLIAWPAAYYFVSQWLKNFAYRISLHPWIFLVGAVTTAAVALISVGYHAVRAASADPVKALRYE